MIVLNNVNKDNTYSLKLVNINKSTTTNEYYKELWKEKYNVNVNSKNKNEQFIDVLVKYLKGDTLYIE